MTVRKYEEKDLTATIQIWNEVVEDGIAFPQEELLTPESGKAFFAGQTLSCVAEEDDQIYGPEFDSFADVIVKNNLTPHILSESAGTQSEDALTMKNIWQSKLLK